MSVLSVSAPPPLSLQTASFVASPLSIPPGLALQEVSVGLGRGRLHSRQSVVVIYGVEDNLVAIRGAPGGTFCNQEWSQLFERTGIQSTDLWLPNTVCVCVCV